MCLDEILPIPKKLPRYGYKIFTKYKGGIEFPCCNDKLPKLGVWLKEFDYRPIEKKKFWYKYLPIWGYQKGKDPFGFHVYLSRRKARNSPLFNVKPTLGFGKDIVKKVEIKKVVAFGKQYGDKVLVCKQIKILKTRKIKQKSKTRRGKKK